MFPTSCLPTDRCALHFEGRSFSYAELADLSDRMAQGLLRLGIGPGSHVGLYLPNTPHYVVALLGAAKLGVIVSGVSPLLTAPEITHQVNDAHIKVLLTLDQLYKAVQPVGSNTPTRSASPNSPENFPPSV